MKITTTFLGTGSMVPTKERNHSAVFIQYGTAGILVDCGEGTQRQFHKAKIPLSKISHIFLSHWHGDHTLGVPGLLQTLSTLHAGTKVSLYGPKGTKEYIKNIQKVFPIEDTIELTVNEIKPGVFFQTPEFQLEAVELDHPLPCLGFIFQEKEYRKVLPAKLKKFNLKPGPDVGKLTEGKPIKVDGKTIDPDDVTEVVVGKKIGIIADTSLCKGCEIIAQDADLLISESSFLKELEEKAEEYGHLTATQAAQIASRNNTKQLILTHFSARYKTPEPLVEEAKDVFENVSAAADLLSITL